MKTLLNSTRWVVGVLFIFSGLVKANDPLGLSYKMQEFFEVWHFHWLDNYTLLFSISMIVFEIVAGIAVLLGWQMRVFSWLLLVLIIFFTFLTGYAYLSGKVRECGCFGNCIPLTAGQSFTKDLILLVLILVVFTYRDQIKPLLAPGSNLAILSAGTILSISLQWFVLHHLPVVDCLPYRVGANIPEKMKSPPGSFPDSVVTTFLYQKNGKEIEIVNNAFPADFDDSYKLVSRSDKLIRKGNDAPPIKDFSLTTLDGVDSTQDLLNQKGYAVFIFTKEFDPSHVSWDKAFNLIYTFCKLNRIPVYFVTANAPSTLAYLDKNGLRQSITVLTCDATAIKTAARVDPTMYLLKKGTILNKWAGEDFDLAVESLNELRGK